MGREVNRVPLDFEWELGKTWWGFMLDAVNCQQCDGSGKLSSDKYCDVCEGEGTQG